MTVLRDSGRFPGLSRKIREGLRKTNVGERSSLDTCSRRSECSEYNGRLGSSVGSPGRVGDEVGRSDKNGGEITTSNMKKTTVFLRQAIAD